MNVCSEEPNQWSCLYGGWVVFLFFFQYFLLAWPDLQEIWNTLLYPLLIPAVPGIEPIRIILIP